MVMTLFFVCEENVSWNKGGRQDWVDLRVAWIFIVCLSEVEERFSTFCCHRENIEI